MKLFSSITNIIGKKIHLEKNRCPDYIRKAVEEYKRRSLVEGKYFLLATPAMQEIINDPNISVENKKYFFNLYKGWDDRGALPLEIGQEIERLINEPDIVVGLHRTIADYAHGRDAILADTVLTSIFNNGLRNDGHLSSGGVSSDIIDPSLTVASMNNMLNAIIALKTRYKDSIGGVLVVFPKALVDEDMHLVGSDSSKQIYNEIDGHLYIKPEYLVGFVEHENGVCTYYPKESFINEKTK